MKNIKYAFIAGIILIAAFCGVFYLQQKNEPVQKTEKLEIKSNLEIKNDFENNLTYEILGDSLDLGTQFLLNNQKPEGNFNYEYDWISKKMNEDDNQVRQAGALWGIALIYNDSPDKKTLAAFKKGFEYFKNHSKETKDGRKWIVYPNDAVGSTGTTALVSLSIIDFLRADEDASNKGISVEFRKELEDDLEKYLDFLVSVRIENGLFYKSYSLESGEGFGSHSPYFDGESLLALVKAAKYLNKNDLIPAILQSAEAAYESYVVEALEKDPDSKDTKGFFQWGCMAYFELASSGWDDTKKYSDIVISLADWMIDVHRTLERTRNTAYAYEGIIHAYELARRKDDIYHTEKFAAVIDERMSKLTSWQVGGPIQNSYLKARPTFDKLAIGGIMNHRKESPLRIDVTQHQMHAVILARKYVYGEISILFLGDTSFGEYYQKSEPKAGRINVLGEKGYEYPLQNFKDILLGADFAIANLEAPITEIETSPFKRKKKYLGKERSDKSPATLKRFNIQAVSLANNHIMDFGEDGLSDTLSSLEKNSIRYFGAGTGEEEARRPLLEDFTVGDGVFKLAVISGFEYISSYDRDFSFYAGEEKGGALKLDKENIAKLIGKIKRQEPDRFVIVYPHWGSNYAWESDKQKDLAEKFITAGADMIIGHGAHQLQKIELISGRWTLYNIGNFMFNSPGRYKKKNAPPFSLISRLVLTGGGDSGIYGALRVYPIFTDNLLTNYQGRFVNREEFNEIHRMLSDKSSAFAEFSRAGEDKFGYYFEILIEDI